MNLCPLRLEVDGVVDVQTLPTRVAFEMRGHAALDLPATHHRIVQQVDGIRKQDRITPLFCLP